VDGPRDEGILACLDAGVVRNVAVLANGPHLEPLARAIRDRPGVGVVLHLNLTEGTALAGPASTLTDREGRFPGDKRAVWESAHRGRLDPAEVAREAAAQWARLREAGLDPVGLNGHNHVHVLPGIREGMVRALPPEPVHPWIRVPACATLPPSGAPPVCEPAMPCRERDMDGIAHRLRDAGHPALAALRTLAAATVHALPGRARFADAFLGCAFAANADPAPLAENLRRVAGDTVELMVHPGRRHAAGVEFSRGENREREVAVLTSPEFAEAVQAAGFTPASLAERP